MPLEFCIFDSKVLSSIDPYITDRQVRGQPQQGQRGPNFDTTLLRMHQSSLKLTALITFSAFYLYKLRITLYN